MTRIAISAIFISILLAGCAQPMKMVGTESGGLGYGGKGFEQAKAECGHEMNTYASDMRRGDMEILFNARSLTVSCMKAKGFVAQQ